MTIRRRLTGRSYDGRDGPRVLAGSASISALILLSVGSAWSARANPQPESIQGVPQQIVPQVAEVGLGNFSIQTGRGVFGGSSDTGGSTGSPVGGTGGGGDNSDALTLMSDQSWGAAAAQNAQALNVSSGALAATCDIESNCQNVGGSGSITGAFQMSASTYTSMINAALAQDPSLASTIVPGLAGQSDPATEAVAAAEYLAQGAQVLQNDGVSNPTALQVRGYYNFGPSGAALATANGDATVASVLPNTSATVLANNGVTPGETVAQWQASVAAKMGGAANTPVLLT